MNTNKTEHSYSYFELMQAINIFTLKHHDGEYKSWPLASELLLAGNATSKRISGYCLEAQYRCGSHYLFITSWDCPFEESYEIILTNENLDLVDQKNIGTMYKSTWLKQHEVVTENQLLLHFDDGFRVRVTVNGGMILEQQLADSSYCPHPNYAATLKISKATKWWKFW
jgi:hypothetical protein